MQSAPEIRIQWMKIMGMDDEEIAEITANSPPATSIEEEQSQLDAAIRLNSIDVPRGKYCYDFKDGVKRVCSYWGMDSSKELQQSGFCTLLNIHDWDELDGVPLLWDKVKECGINNETR